MPWPAANNLEFVMEPMASRAVLTRETRACLRRTIAGLPEHLRTALVLYYARECSLAECGAVLDVPASRVSQMLAEARARLRRAL